MLKKLEIFGLRGFATKQGLNIAVPDGRDGSGLTAVVGANNAGKSTIVESFRALNQRRPPGFTQGRRNIAAGDRVEITITDTANAKAVLRSIHEGSSQSELADDAAAVARKKILVLPSRRVFNAYFGEGTSTRESYISQIGFPDQRTSTVNEFSARLFAIEKSRAAFDAVLSKVLDPVPDWSIDKTDTGQYFLKVRKGGAYHSSEGLGEGLVSLLYIIDALHDSAEGDCIVIDEPELSLHPALQRKLSALLVAYAATRQIILATHSPYFTRIDVLAVGATVARVHLDPAGTSKISQLTSDTAQDLTALLANANNPHILGLNAQEIFFVEDEVILLEGQEDIVFFPKVRDQFLPQMRGTLFGWGVGGADNMALIAKALNELGFTRVVGILDANKANLIEGLSKQLPGYHFVSIAADDIRSKSAQAAKIAVRGLLDDDNRNVREEFRPQTEALLQDVSRYFETH